MFFIFNPLIINIILALITIILIKIVIKFIRLWVYPSSNIFQYKIKNITLSFIGIIIDIVIFIVIFYLLRYLNLPRNFDLKNLVVFSVKCNEQFLEVFEVDSKLLQIYILCNIILLVIICVCSIINIHKMMRKEIYKFFLYFIADQYPKNFFTKWIINKFSAIACGHDILHYLLIKFSYNLNVKLNGKYDMTKPTIISVFISNKYYKRFMQFSPMIIIIYDCLFNDFVLTHVFYYMLFYIPLRLFKQIVNPFLDYAPYITNMLYNIYYIDENCLYVIPLNLKIFLDNYIHTGIVKNIHWGLQPEIYISATARFEDYIVDGQPNNQGIYINLDGLFIHTNDHKHFFHVIEDEDGNPIHGQEWIVFVNKLKL